MQPAFNDALRLRQSVLGIALSTYAALSACRDQPTVTNQLDLRAGRDQPQFAITANPATVADVPADLREMEVGKAFTAIAARLPAAQGKEFLERMKRGIVGRPVSSRDPEIARLWSRILSLRTAADAESRRPKALLNSVSQQAAVRVALVGSLEDPTFRAMVVRRPDDGGVPLLLLSERGATGEDLLRGLQAASRSINSYESQPGKQAIIAIKFGAKRREPSNRVRASFAQWEIALAQLRQQPQVDLKGYGRARVMVMPGNRN